MILKSDSLSYVQSGMPTLGTPEFNQGSEVGVGVYIIHYTGNGDVILIGLLRHADYPDISNLCTSTTYVQNVEAGSSSVGAPVSSLCQMH